MATKTPAKATSKPSAKTAGKTSAAKTASNVLSREAMSSAAWERAEPGDWLSAALEHHDVIRASFEAALKAPPGGGRLTALKGIAMVLNGHSLAEEVVLYPALLATGAEADAEAAYAEQTEAKIEMAKLEEIDPMSEAWAAQLQKIQTAVFAHMQEEETGWFLTIKENAPNQDRLSRRYREEFERYTRTGVVAVNLP